MNRYRLCSVTVIILALQLTASSVCVQHVKGDVRVRRGLEESWVPAGAGMVLETMDTILSGEASEVVLILEDDTKFHLGANAILDISDLRRITERQLFLYLMSQKVGRLDVPEAPSKIHIANVSVVRGSNKNDDDSEKGPARTNNWIREMNGARALFSAGYHINAIMKFYRIMERYPSIDDQGEIHMVLGQSFEAIDERGRASEAYQIALEQIQSSERSQSLIRRKIRIEEALNRLKADPSF